MHFTTLAALAATFLAAQALPSNTPRGLPGAVYVCTGPDFTGDCTWIPPTSECHTVGQGAQSLKSIGPDQGGYCALKSKADCSGDVVLRVAYPGVGSNLPAFAGMVCCAQGC